MHICILFFALLSGAIYSKAVTRFEDVGWKDKEQENSPELPCLKSCHFPSWQPVPNKLLIRIYWCKRVASALALWIWMQLTKTLHFSQALGLNSHLPHACSISQNPDPLYGIIKVINYYCYYYYLWHDPTMLCETVKSNAWRRRKQKKEQNQKWKHILKYLLSHTELKHS